LNHFENDAVILDVSHIENESVIDNVVIVWNKTQNLKYVDNYLLNEAKCTSEEREDFVESIWAYIDSLNHVSKER